MNYKILKLYDYFKYVNYMTIKFHNK